MLPNTKQRSRSSLSYSQSGTRRVLRSIACNRSRMRGGYERACVEGDNVIVVSLLGPAWDADAEKIDPEILARKCGVRGEHCVEVHDSYVPSVRTESCGIIDKTETVLQAAEREGIAGRVQVGMIVEDGAKTDDAVADHVQGRKKRKLTRGERRSQSGHGG